MAARHKTRRENWFFFIFLIAYFLFEACFVSFISLGAGLDDAELISNLSFWNWGYGGSQPPLYTWLAYGLTSIFGLHFIVLQFLRFSLLGSSFFAVYIGLRLLRAARPLAAFACLSMFLLPQIGWESQRALIHSVLGTAGSAWSFAAFIWFVQKPGYKRALCLAVAITAAVLGKYNGLIFIAALFMSGFFLGAVRRALLTRYFAAVVAAALALMAPALIFMVLHPESVVERAVKFRAGQGGNWFVVRVEGLLDLVRASLAFVLPALIAAAIIGLIIWRQSRRRAGNEQKALRLDGLACGGQARARNPAGGQQAAGLAVRQASLWRPGAGEEPGLRAMGKAPGLTGGRPAAENLPDPASAMAAINQGNIQAAMRFLQVVLLCALAVCALMVLFSGATYVKDRWLQPVLFLAPPYAALWLAQLDISGRAARAFGLLGLAAACIVPPMLYANLYARGLAMGGACETGDVRGLAVGGACETDEARGSGVRLAGDAPQTEIMGGADKAKKTREGKTKLPIQNLDYPALYAGLSANGPIAVLLAPDPFYAGNLRLINPQIKTLFTETPFAARRLRRPLVVLWKNTPELPQKLASIMTAAGIDRHSLPPARLLIVPYRLQKGQNQPSERLYYIYLP